MMETIMNPLLLILGSVLFALLIRALSHGGDGECTYKDCNCCPYGGGCPWEVRV